MKIQVLLLAAALTGAPAGAGGGPAAAAAAPAGSREEPFAVRAFTPYRGDRWIGNGIAYGPHRDGERPGGASPTRDELRQDLHLLACHWHLLRLYASTGPAADVLSIIAADSLDLKVMLGVWIAPGTRADGAPDSAAAAAGRAEIESGIRLAHDYPGIVAALSAGNETQVAWSDHRVDPARLVAVLRELRARSEVPVTTADDYNFWNKLESDAVAAEVDFITVHAHPLWNGIPLEDAVDWTRKTVESIRAAHPGREVVLGETGWATRRGTEGDQGKLMKGAVGEPEQAVFYRALREWTERERLTTFYFEAFDENWKGGPAPEEVEKHWGLYRADRTPKAAMAGGR